MARYITDIFETPDLKDYFEEYEHKLYEQYKEIANSVFKQYYEQKAKEIVKEVIDWIIRTEGYGYIGFKIRRNEIWYRVVSKEGNVVLDKEVEDIYPIKNFAEAYIYHVIFGISLANSYLKFFQPVEPEKIVGDIPIFDYKVPLQEIFEKAVEEKGCIIVKKRETAKGYSYNIVCNDHLLTASIDEDFDTIDIYYLTSVKGISLEEIA